MIFDLMAIAERIWQDHICNTRYFLQDFSLPPRFTACAPLLAAFDFSLAYNKRYDGAGFQFPSHLRPLCRLHFCLPVFYRQTALAHLACGFLKTNLFFTSFSKIS
jgi:hypothetical protein